MTLWEDRLNQLIQRLCDWLNDHTSGGHPLAVAADTMARGNRGVGQLIPDLPEHLHELFELFWGHILMLLGQSTR